MEGRRSITKYVTSKVEFKKLSDQEITAYVATGEPMDKAGGYGAQDKGGVFIESITGDYFNVVGLPVFAVAKVLKEFGVDIIRSW